MEAISEILGGPSGSLPKRVFTCKIFPVGISVKYAASLLMENGSTEICGGPSGSLPRGVLEVFATAHSSSEFISSIFSKFTDEAFFNGVEF